MRVAVIFIVAALFCVVATAANALSLSKDLEAEKQQFLHFNKHGFATTKNLSLASLPGCITMSSCKICGYYCGPGWCSDEYITETSCVATGVWGIPPIEGSEQCVDNCCRTHDHCCGAGVDRSACNTNIVSCIDSNGCGGLCADAVWAALKIVSHFCCGSRCPSYSADEHGNYVRMDLAAQSFCHAESGLRLTFKKSSNGAAVVKNGNDDIDHFLADVAVADVDAADKKNAEVCASSLSVQLNQKSNRVAIGSTEFDKMALPDACIAKSQLAKDLSAGSKIWYFPETKELLVRNLKVEDKIASYFTMNKC